jgi:hypothetical protein
MRIKTLMERRRLGHTGIAVSALGFGASELGQKRMASKTAAYILGSALDAGLNVVDTAACYGNSEELVGRSVVIAVRISIFSLNAATHQDLDSTIGRRRSLNPASTAVSSACAPIISTLCSFIRVMSNNCGRVNLRRRSSVLAIRASCVTSAIAETAKRHCTLLSVGHSILFKFR